VELTRTQIAHAKDRPIGHPDKFVLILSPKPRAHSVKYLTIPCRFHGECTVEKYSTKFGTTFEKHIAPNGVSTWWKLTAPGFVYDWESGTWRVP
jgi:hypothetical protein